MGLVRKIKALQKKKNIKEVPFRGRLSIDETLLVL